MYKIYINGTPLLLSAFPEDGFQPDSNPRHMATRYTGNPRSVLSYMDLLEKNARFDQVTLYAKDAEQLFRDFCSQFNVIPAAGGLVFNDKGEALLIFRRGSWDLPKGKIDPGESPEEAAVREVQEETGLKQVSLHELIATTYHTYRHKKDGRVLKPTYWYRMSAPEQALTPQAEEGIEQAVWQPIGAFLNQKGLTVYPNIVDVLRQAR